MNMLSRFRYLLTFTLLCATNCAAAPPAGMTPLIDDDLEAITARSGMAFNLEYRINALADGSADTCPTVGSATTCRIAVDFADRFGAWIVMKSYRGIFGLRNVFFDVAPLPGSWTSYTGNGTTPNPYINGFDPRFRPSMQLSAGSWRTAQAAGTNALNDYLNASLFNDMSAALNISRLSAEFDCGIATNTAIGILTAGCSAASPGWSVDRVPGYLRDAVPGSAVSLRYADGGISSNTPMAIRLDGRLNVFGY